MEYRLFPSIKEVTIKEEHEVRQDIYVLWQECFGDSEIYTDFYFDWKISENQVFLIYYDSELAAMLHLNPYTLVAKGREISANYIVGVATKESHRRKGLMCNLLSASMGQMYDDKMPFTYLMPAKESIYLPFDFRIVYEQDFWNDKLIQVQTNRDKKNIDTKTFKVMALDENDTNKIDELVSFTKKYLTNEYDVFVKPTPYYYKRLINEMKSSNGEVLLCYDQGELIGYLSYMAEQAVYITELIANREKEQEVIREIWDYLASITQTSIFRRKQGSQITGIMTRVVNLKEFIKNLRANSPISLVLEITDPIIKQNQGRFLVSIDDASGSIKKTRKKADLVIDIADLAKMFFGKLKEEELDKLLLQIKESEAQEIKAKLGKVSFYESLFINDVV